jgi:CheY-like chemotaxis protein
MMINICLDELGVREDELFEFASAVEAVEDFGENYYDLIFCDLHMPEMDGHDLIQAIYEQYPHLDSSRIVMISGEEDGSYKQLAKEFGVKQFMKKPIKPPVFLHHIKPLISMLRRQEAK